MLPIFRVAALAMFAAASSAIAQPISLDEALRRTLITTPEGRAGAARLEALAAARRQAGVKPNPSVEVFAENFPSTGSNAGLDTINLTGTYAQAIERGGKRDARVSLASSEIGLAEAELLLARLDIAARVQRAYVEAVAAEAEIAVATEKLRGAESLAREVDRRVQAARDPIFAGTRAATRVAEAKVDLELAVHARDAAVERLAALWGGSAEGVTVSTADFLRFDESHLSPDATAPETAVIAARAQRADAAIALEKSRAVQDITWRGGVRYLRPGDDLALVGGFTIPLGRNDTNRDNIARAMAERRRIDADAEVAAAQRRRDLALADEKVHEAALEAVAIRDRVIPGAEKTLAQVREGYARGGFSYLDVAEAQSALAAARARLVRAARAHKEAGVELDRLTGRFANLTNDEEVR
jgi:cobalt-zinc-cadmium efflux system outer membrane protein